MKGLEIHVLGSPRVVCSSGPCTISPRLAFELLVVTAISPGRRIGRVEAAKALWPQFARPKQLAQLRFTLSRLKSELERIGYPGWLGSSKSEIWIEGLMEMDTDPLLTPGPPAPFSPGFLVPVLAGWDSPAATGIRTRVGAALAETVYVHASRLSASSPSSALEATGAYLALYPFNSKVAALQCALQRRRGDEAGALNTRELYEVAWLDEYGAQGMPDLDSVGLDMPAALNSGRSVGRRTMIAVAMITAIVFATGYMLSKGRQGATPRVGQPYERTILGKRYRFLPFAMAPKTEVVHMAMLYDERLLLTVKSADGNKQMFVLDRTGSNEPGRNFAPVAVTDGCTLADAGGGQELYDCVDAKGYHFARKVSKGRVTDFRGIAGYPHAAPLKIFPEGVVGLNRWCDHPEGCHYRQVLLKNGKEVPLSPADNPRVSYMRFVQEDSVYGIYSMGPSTKWRPQGYVYNMVSGQSKPIPVVNPVARRTDGTMVYGEQSVSELNGQIQVSGTGRYRVISPNGKETLLQVDGRDTFEECLMIGDLLFLRLGGVQYWAISDFEGRRVAEVEDLASASTSMSPIAWDMALIKLRPKKQTDKTESRFEIMEMRGD